MHPTVQILNVMYLKRSASLATGFGVHFAYPYIGDEYMDQNLLASRDALRNIFLYNHTHLIFKKNWIDNSYINENAKNIGNK